MITRSFFLRLYLSAMMVSLVSMTASAQVTIGSSNPPSKFALLDLDNSEQQAKPKGLHLPRLSEEYRDALVNLISEQNDKDLAVGLLIYNTDINCVEFWNGEEWISLCEGDTPAPPCGSGGTALPMQIGNNTYLTHEYMTNGVMRCWMVENSREGTPRNMSTTGIYNDVSVWNQYSGQAVGERGFYYTFATAQTDACPAGWSVPTITEFGNSLTEGLWSTLDAMPANNNADNPRRFWSNDASHLAGRRGTGGSWLDWDTYGYWWTNSSVTPTIGRSFFGHNAGTLSAGTTFNVGTGFSVRCIKDL